MTIHILNYSYAFMKLSLISNDSVSRAGPTNTNAYTFLRVSNKTKQNKTNKTRVSSKSSDTNQTTKCRLNEANKEQMVCYKSFFLHPFKLDK